MAKQGVPPAVPRLRFPEFLNAPEWGITPMDKLYLFMRNNVLSRDKLNYERGIAKNIHYGDIHTKFPALFDITKERVPFINDSEVVPDADSEDYCVEGDVIFADASEDTNDVGKSMEVVRLAGELLLAGQHTILARRRDDTLVVGFGGHLFRSGLIRSRIEKEAQGTKVYQISSSRLGGIDITFPRDKTEQQKIADCLTSLDEVIAAQGRKVEALKTHKCGLMQQLFPRESETRPRLRFPDFRNAGEWERMTFGQAATFHNGRAYKQEELLESGRFPVLRVGNFFTNTTWYHSDLELDETKYCESGDLLYAWSASFGPRIWRGEKSIYHYHIWKVIEQRGIDKMFLFITLENETENMKAKTTNGLGIMHITKGAIESWESSFPTISEQRKIAGFLTSLDNTITAEIERLDTFKTHKVGLMKQLFPSTYVIQS